MPSLWAPESQSPNAAVDVQTSNRHEKSFHTYRVHTLKTDHLGWERTSFECIGQ
jgi:hypothetical protein